MFIVVVLLVVLVFGFVFAMGGSVWWYIFIVGCFMNLVHFWSVELFFVFMVIYLWGKFWMVVWCGCWILMWVMGVVVFLGLIGMVFIGYLL